MNNFWTLVSFEYKKIFTKKFFIGFFLLVSFISVSALGIVIGDYYVDGEVVNSKYEEFIIDKNHELSLSGRNIDADFIKEATTAYALYPEIGNIEQQRQITQDYIRKYFGIGKVIKLYYGESDWVEIGKLSEQEISSFYSIKEDRTRSDINKLLINDNSKNTLINLSEKIESPTIYQYSDGYMLSIIMLNSTALVVVFFIIVFLSGIFSKEYQTNVISLQHTSKNGKKQLFSAKTFVVFTVSSMVSLVIILINTVICLVVYGVEGATAALQNQIILSPYPLTMIEAMIIDFFVVFLAIMFFSFIVMLISSFSKSTMMVFAVSTALLIIPQFLTVSRANTNLFRLYNLYPTTSFAHYNVFSTILYEIANVSIQPYIFIPFTHVVLSILCILLSYKIFKHHQVS